MSAPGVVFEPGCVALGNVVVCGSGGVTIRRIGHCWGLCDKPDARLVDRLPNSPYWGIDTSCECGDSWNDDLRQRPFERGWRVKAQARFEKSWNEALPVGTKEIRDMSEEGGMWLTGVRLPDGTEVTR